MSSLSDIEFNNGLILGHNRSDRSRLAGSSQILVRVHTPHVQCRYYGEVMTDDTLTEPLHTLDLRNRGITSITDRGLGCYTMQSVILPPNAERWHQSALLTHLK